MEKQNSARHIEPNGAPKQRHCYLDKNVTDSRSLDSTSIGQAESVAATFNLVPNVHLIPVSYLQRFPDTSHLHPAQNTYSSANCSRSTNSSYINIQPKRKATADAVNIYQGNTQPYFVDQNYSANAVYPCAVFVNDGMDAAANAMLKVSNAATQAQAENTSIQIESINDTPISTTNLNASTEAISALGDIETGWPRNNTFLVQPIQGLHLLSTSVGQPHAVNSHNNNTVFREPGPDYASNSITSTQCLDHGRKDANTGHKSSPPSTAPSLPNKQIPNLTHNTKMDSSTKVSSTVSNNKNDTVASVSVNCPFPSKLKQVSRVIESKASNVNNLHNSKTPAVSTRNGSPTISSTYTDNLSTNKKTTGNKEAIIDVETEDIEDCMLVSVDLSKRMSSIGSKIHNLQVVIDSDEDEPVVTSTKKSDSNQAQQGKTNDKGPELSSDTSQAQTTESGPQNATSLPITSVYPLLSNMLFPASPADAVQDKDIEVYIDQDIKEERPLFDPGVQLWQSTNLESTSERLQNSEEANSIHESMPPPKSSSGSVDLAYSDTDSLSIATARTNFTKTLNKVTESQEPMDLPSIPEITSTIKKTGRLSETQTNLRCPPKKAVLSVSAMLKTGEKTNLFKQTKASDNTAEDPILELSSVDERVSNEELNEAETTDVPQNISIASSLSFDLRGKEAVKSTVETEVKKEPAEESYMNSSVSGTAEKSSTEPINSCGTLNMNNTNNNENTFSAKNLPSGPSQIANRFDLAASESTCLKCKRTFSSSTLMQEHLKCSLSCKAYTDKLLSQHKPKDKDVLCCVSCHHISNNIDNKFQHVAGNSVCFQRYASLCMSCNAKVSFTSEDDRFAQTRTCRKRHLLAPSIEASNSLDEMRTKQNTGLLLMSAGVATLSSVNPPTSCTVRCESCSSWFSSYARFKLHVRGYPSCKKFYDDRYTTQRNLDSDQPKKEKSTNKPNILCPVCSKKFATNAMLTIHLNENTSCRSTFLKNSAPKVAKRGGDSERKKSGTSLPNTSFDTTVDKGSSKISGNTDVQYSTKFNLKEMVIKLSPKSIMCTFCHKAFLDGNALSKHMSSSPLCIKQPEDIRFQCKGCNKYFIGDEGLAKHIQKSYLCQAKIDSMCTPASSNVVETNPISEELNRGQKRASPKIQKVHVLDVDVKDSQQSKTVPEVIRPHECFELQEIPVSNPQPSVSAPKEDEIEEIAHVFSGEESDEEGSSSTSSDEADVEYRCKTCNKVFTQKMLFKQHMRQHRQVSGQVTGHGSQKIKCGSCRKKIKSQKYYQAHLLKKSLCFLKVTKKFWYKKPGDILSCKMCNKVLKSLHDLGKHSFKNMTCRICYVDAVLNFNSSPEASSTSSREAHVSLNEESKNRYQVSSSGQVLESPAKQNIHQTHLSLECEHCHIVFDSSFKFQLHFFTEKPDCLEHYAKLGPELQAQVPYCFRCKNRFINTQKLRVHKCIGYRRYVRVCGHCNFKFPSLMSLEAHAQNNENCAKALEMNAQGKSYHLQNKPKEVARKTTKIPGSKKTRQSNKKVMMESAKAPNQAKNAGKELLTSSSSYKASKEFSCRVCFCKFSNHFLLLEHSNEHTEEKQYDCKRCGFMCYRYNRLVSHEAVHERLDKECEHFDDRLDLHSVVVPDRSNSDHETNASDEGGETDEQRNVCNGCGIHFDCDRGLRKHLSCSNRCKIIRESFGEKRRENVKQEDLSLTAAEHGNYKKSMPTVRPSVKIVSKIGSSGKRFLTAAPVEQVPREDHLYCFSCHRFLKSEEDVERHAVYKRHTLLSRRIFRKAVWFPGDYSCKICKVDMVQKSSLVAHMVRKHNKGTSSLLKVLPHLDNLSQQVPSEKQSPAPKLYNGSFCILCKKFIANNKKRNHFTAHVNALISDTKASSPLPLTHPSRETCKICHLTQVSRVGLLKHFKRHREDDIFASHSSLHQSKAHNTFPLPCIAASGQRLKPRSTSGRCKLCQKKFLSISVFQRHFKLSHSNRYSNSLLYYVKNSDKPTNEVKKTAGGHVLPPKKKESQTIKPEISITSKKCNPERKINFTSHFVKGKNILRIHRSKKSKFFCKICKWTSTRRSTLKNHIQQKHRNDLPTSDHFLVIENGRHLCTICNGSFESSNGYKNHFAKKHKERDGLNSLVGSGSPDISIDAEPGFSFQKKRVLHCKLCKSKVKAVLYGKHLMMRHSWLKGNLHPCNYCRVDFPYEEDLYNHILQCEKDCYCLVCCKQLNSLQGFRNHIIGFHKLPWDKYVSEKINLGQKPVEIEATTNLNYELCMEEKQTLTCSLCDDIFEEAGIYLEHMKTHLIACKVDLGKKAKAVHKDLKEEELDMLDTCKDIEFTGGKNIWPGVTSVICDVDTSNLDAEDTTFIDALCESQLNKEKHTSLSEQQNENKTNFKEIDVTASDANTAKSPAIKTRDTSLQEQQVQILEEELGTSSLTLKEIGPDCLVDKTVQELTKGARNKVSLQDQACVQNVYAAQEPTCSENLKRKALDANLDESGLSTEKRKNMENYDTVEGGKSISDNTLQGHIRLRATTSPQNTGSNSLQKIMNENCGLQVLDAATVTDRHAISSTNTSNLTDVEDNGLYIGSQVTKDCAQSNSLNVCTTNPDLLVDIKTERPDPDVYSESRNLFTVLNDSVNLVDDEDGELLFVSYHKPTLEDFVKPRSPIDVPPNIPQTAVSNDIGTNSTSNGNTCSKLSSVVPESDPVSSSSGFSDDTRNVFDMLNK